MRPSLDARNQHATLPPMFLSDRYGDRLIAIGNPAGGAGGVAYAPHIDHHGHRALPLSARRGRVATPDS